MSDLSDLFETARKKKREEAKGRPSPRPGGLPPREPSPDSDLSSLIARQHDPDLSSSTSLSATSGTTATSSTSKQSLVALFDEAREGKITAKDTGKKSAGGANAHGLAGAGEARPGAATTPAPNLQAGSDVGSAASKSSSLLEMYNEARHRGGTKKMTPDALLPPADSSNTEKYGHVGGLPGPRGRSYKQEVSPSAGCGDAASRHATPSATLGESHRYGKPMPAIPTTAARTGLDVQPVLAAQHTSTNSPYYTNAAGQQGSAPLSAAPKVRGATASRSPIISTSASPHASPDAPASSGDRNTGGQQDSASGNLDADKPKPKVVRFQGITGTDTAAASQSSCSPPKDLGPPSEAMPSARPHGNTSSSTNNYGHAIKETPSSAHSPGPLAVAPTGDDHKQARAAWPPERRLTHARAAATNDGTLPGPDSLAHVSLALRPLTRLTDALEPRASPEVATVVHRHRASPQSAAVAPPQTPQTQGPKDLTTRAKIAAIPPKSPPVPKPPTNSKPTVQHGAFAELHSVFGQATAGPAVKGQARGLGSGVGPKEEKGELHDEQSATGGKAERTGGLIAFLNRSHLFTARLDAGKLTTGLGADATRPASSGPRRGTPDPTPVSPQPRAIPEPTAQKSFFGRFGDSAYHAFFNDADPVARFLHKLLIWLFLIVLAFLAALLGVWLVGAGLSFSAPRLAGSIVRTIFSTLPGGVIDAASDVLADWGSRIGGGWSGWVASPIASGWTMARNVTQPALFVAWNITLPAARGIANLLGSHQPDGNPVAPPLGNINALERLPGIAVAATALSHAQATLSAIPSLPSAVSIAAGNLPEPSLLSQLGRSDADAAKNTYGTLERERRDIDMFEAMLHRILREIDERNAAALSQTGDGKQQAGRASSSSWFSSWAWHGQADPEQAIHDLATRIASHLSAAMQQRALWNGELKTGRVVREVGNAKDSVCEFRDEMQSELFPALDPDSLQDRSSTGYDHDGGMLDHDGKSLTGMEDVYSGMHMVCTVLQYDVKVLFAHLELLDGDLRWLRAQHTKVQRRMVPHPDDSGEQSQKAIQSHASTLQETLDAWKDKIEAWYHEGK